MKEIRRKLLIDLIAGPRFEGNRQSFCSAAGITEGRLSQLLTAGAPFGDVAAKNLDDALGLADSYFEKPVIGLHRKAVNSDEFAIPQFDARGAMGDGLVLRDQPGMIRSWTVNKEWISKNLKNHTGAANLCIVTGFGDSMKGIVESQPKLSQFRSFTR